jgi:hypothetical protein
LNAGSRTRSHPLSDKNPNVSRRGTARSLCRLQRTALSPYRGVAPTVSTCTSSSSTRSPCATLLIFLQIPRKTTWLCRRRGKRTWLCSAASLTWLVSSASSRTRSDNFGNTRLRAPHGPNHARHRRPYLVTPGPGLPSKERSGRPLTEAYEQHRDFLFVHLHDEGRERGEGIMSFYVRRSIYLAFFNTPGTRGNAAATFVPAPGIRQSRERGRAEGRYT